MIVCAVDPGYGTGYATYDVGAGEFDSWETYNGELDLLRLAQLAVEVVVCEAYTVTERTAQYTQQTDALRHIGKIEQFCASHPLFPDLVMQQPSAKKFAKPNKLKLLGWHKKTKDSHADDAAAHLLCYLVKARLLRADDLVKLKGALS